MSECFSRMVNKSLCQPDNRCFTITTKATGVSTNMILWYFNVAAMNTSNLLYLNSTNVCQNYIWNVPQKVFEHIWRGIGVCHILLFDLWGQVIIIKRFTGWGCGAFFPQAWLGFSSKASCVELCACWDHRAVTRVWVTDTSRAEACPAARQGQSVPC